PFIARRSHRRSAAGTVVTQRGASRGSDNEATMTWRRGHAIDAANRIARNPAMNTAELVAKLAEAHGVSKAQAKSIVDDILKDIVDAAASGEEVSLPG